MLDSRFNVLVIATMHYVPKELILFAFQKSSDIVNFLIWGKKQLPMPCLNPLVQSVPVLAGSTSLTKTTS
jgi:hypothetical protein